MRSWQVMRTSHSPKGLLQLQRQGSRQLCSLVVHVVMQRQLRLPIATALRWSLLGGGTTDVNALHPAQRRLIPRADTECSSFAFSASLHITQLTSRTVPPRRR